MSNNNYYCFDYDDLFIDRDSDSYGEKNPNIDTKEESSYKDDLLDSDDEYQSLLDTTAELTFNKNLLPRNSHKHEEENITNKK